MPPIKTIIQNLFRSLILLLYALSIAPAYGEDTPLVIWRVTDWPPFYIIDGALKGRGLYDLMIDEYQKAAPEFEHTKIEMTTMRALQQMKNRQEGVAICHVSMLRNALTGFAHASELNSLLLAHVIFASKEAAPKIRALAEDGGHHVSIEKLFLSEALKGAHTSYGTHAVLEKFQYSYPPLPNITLTAENYHNLARLFLEGRVDYIVQYEPYLETLMSMGGKKDDIEVIEIAETKGAPYVKVYAGCTKNAIGERMVKAIDQVLLSKPENLQQARLQWYLPHHKKQLVGFYEEIAPELNDF